MATYVVGDVHGCLDALQRLLDKIQFNDNDTLWLVGDLVNRGPDSLGVLRFLQGIRQCQVVLGNHDLHLLALRYGARYFPVNEQLAPILRADDGEELCAWLQSWPLLHHDEALNVVMVHAGIWPKWSLAEAKQAAQFAESLLASTDTAVWHQLYGNTPETYDQQDAPIDRQRFVINAFTRMRFCDADAVLNFTHVGAEGTQPASLMPWYRCPQRKTLTQDVVFGHWAALRGEVGVDGIHAVDTGCAWGESLTAWRVSDQERITVIYQ
jgi:bis(5'-nucleosyl)-tetraphosphatase (symmetrical)